MRREMDNGGLSEAMGTRATPASVKLTAEVLASRVANTRPSELRQLNASCTAAVLCPAWQQA